MNHLWVTLLAVLATNVNADTDTSPWHDIAARGTPTGAETHLQHYRLLGLDEAPLKEQLAQAKLSLPLPDGSFAAVTATLTETLAPEIAAEYPDIQTWKVLGTDGKVISGVIDFTAQGFHAMLDMANGDTLFIDPQADGDSRQYLSFRKSANREAFHQGDWSCTTPHGDSSIPSFSATLPAGTAARTVTAKAGEIRHSYRIAIAATGEYTAYHGGQQAAYNSIVTTVNRINQIYERDLSTHLTLVSGTNIVYTNASSDPYSNNAPNQMLSQNTETLNNSKILGVNNYDIGHVLATDGGGLASVATTCGEDKAEGVTGLSKPEGDAFIIDYVSHEIGHQLGASHTFNSQLGACAGGNREAQSAYEPGSGSTIMAYTGLCNTDNLQTDSDSMMHSASIQQITDYLHNGVGASCASKTSLANANPVANAGSNYNIPAGTPFILNGSGSDTNNDTLSYSWEQLDKGSASKVNVDLGNNALIRAHLPTSSPTRTIPQLSDLIDRVRTAGEALPATSRKLNFRLLVRDGRGGVGYDDTQLSVQDTGSVFAVTAPTSTSLSAGSPLSVTWNVAATDQPPISCSSVDIAISSDNGKAFTTLLSNTPNDGGAVVTLPVSLGSKTYLRVKCSNNIFFAMSATTPAKARTSNDATDSDTVSINASTLGSSDSGGGGSVPYELLLLGGVYTLLRLRKGSAR